MWQSPTRNSLEQTLGASREVHGPAKSRILLGVTVRPTAAWIGSAAGAWFLEWGGELWVPPC